MQEDANIAVGRRRLRGFVIHLAAYFGGMIALVAVNFLTDAKDPWFLWPLVGWGSVLALHVAYVMGLFDTIKNDDR